MNRKLLLLLVVLILAGGVVAYVKWSRPTALVLTGIVTTNDVIVSPQIAGQIGELMVNEGDQVKRGQLIAVITPDELRTDIDYYTRTAEGLTSQVKESEAALRLQQQQTTDQIRQAEATLASALARSSAEQVTIKRSQVQSSQSQQAAANAQRAKARVRLAYTELHAPIVG